MKKYDVIIIGAGPGGLKCAEVLGAKGKTVLLIEKNKSIGPKICAGGLTRKAFKVLGSPDEIIERKFQNIHFVSLHQKTKLEFGSDFLYTIDREVLGQWQLERLKKFHNVKVDTSTEVISINKNSVVTNKNEKIYFEKLVGADGSNSIVRKFLKRTTVFVGLAFHYLVPKEKCKHFSEPEIHFNSKLFAAWYAWIFPHEKYVSIGFGYPRNEISLGEARQRFSRWLKQMNIEVEDNQFRSFPINCDYQGFSFGGGKYFLVGDAAGLASGLTGEGICQAIISGSDVANKIINADHHCDGIKSVRREKMVHTFMLRCIIYLLIFKDSVFEVVTFVTKNKFIARTLLRVLT